MAVCPRASWEVPLIVRIRLCLLRDSTPFTASFIDLFDINVAQMPYAIRHDKKSRSPLLLHGQSRRRGHVTIRDLTAFASLFIRQTKIIAKRLISTDLKVTYRPSTDVII